MNDYGIKISRSKIPEGSQSLKDLLYHSAHPFLKIKKIGEGSISYTHDGGSATEISVFRHGLGYKPLFKVLTQWFDIDTSTKQNDYRNAPFTDTLLGGATYFRARPYVTREELRYSVTSFDGSGAQAITLNFIYAIYYDLGEDT